MPRLFQSNSDTKARRPSSVKSVPAPARRPSTAFDVFEDESIAKNSKVSDVSPDKLNTYIESLYEDLQAKMKGTSALKELAARDSTFLYQIAQNDSIISALSRVLIEDGRRSMELTINILFIFLSLTAIPELRSKILQNRIGDTTMKTIQREIGRFALWKTEIETMRASLKEGAKSKGLTEKLDKIKVLIKRQDELFFVSFSLLMRLGDDLTIEIKMVKRDIVGFLSSALEIQTTRGSIFSVSKNSETSEGAASVSVMVVVLTLLFRLTAFKENHMRILSLDTSFLEHILYVIRHMDKKLEIWGMKILSNLSQTPSFRSKMALVPGLLDTCSTLMTDPSPKISSLSTRLLYFVSMDPVGRENIADTSIIPNAMRRVLECTQNLIPLELGSLLYNLSQEEHCVMMICGLGSDNADAGIGLKLILKRAFKTLDPIIWKTLRVIASCNSQNVKMLFLENLDDIMKCCSRLDDKAAFRQDQEQHAIILLSIIGILGSLEIEDFDFTRLNEKYDLLTLISTQILTNLNLTRLHIRNPSLDDPAKVLSDAIEPSDDILIESIILLKTMLTDENIVTEIEKYKIANPDATTPVPGRPTVASGRKSSIIPQQYSMYQLLFEVLQLKQDDVEILYQTLQALYGLLCAGATCDTVLKDSRMVDKFFNLMWDQNVDIRSYANLCLTLLEDYETESGVGGGYISKTAREKRFQCHNAEWVMAVQDKVLEIIQNYQEDDGCGEPIDRFSADGQGIMIAEGEDLFGDENGDDVPDLEQVMIHDGQQIQFV